jgi:hypothetical protein
MLSGEDGFRLVYFIEEAELYRDFLADKRKREEDFNTWKTGLGELESAQKWAYRFALESY